VTVPDETEAPLWAVGSGRPRPRPLPKQCAMCASPPASVFGLCVAHLEQAAAELTRLAPAQRPAERDDRRPSSVPFSALCARCGRSGHEARRCDA
jgi:hypothetical protein